MQTQRKASWLPISLIVLAGAVIVIALAAAGSAGPALAVTVGLVAILHGWGKL